MKETTIKLADEIADFIENEAKEMGVSAADLIRFIIGSYVQGERRASQPYGGVVISMKGMFDSLEHYMKGAIRERAKEGKLSCKDCTMKISEKDIDDGKCSSCGASLKEMLGMGEGGP